MQIPALQGQSRRDLPTPARPGWEQDGPVRGGGGWMSFAGDEATAAPSWGPAPKGTSRPRVSSRKPSLPPAHFLPGEGRRA